MACLTMLNVYRVCTSERLDMYAWPTPHGVFDCGAKLVEDFKYVGLHLGLVGCMHVNANANAKSVFLHLIPNS